MNFAIVILLASPIAEAGEKPKLKETHLECPSLQDLSERVRFCSDSRDVVRAARMCHDRLLEEWRNAPADLQKVLSLSTRDGAISSQEKEFANSHSDLSLTEARLKNLLAVTKANTDLVASYPTIMLDTPDMRNPEAESAPCYWAAYDQIQEMVWNLDDKIHEGENAYAAVAKMNGTVLARDERVGAKDSLTQLAHGARAVASAPMVGGQASGGISSITGVEVARRKEAVSQNVIRLKWKPSIR